MTGKGVKGTIAKGVVARWGLPADERYVGIPDAVFELFVRPDLTGTDWFVFTAILRRWNWRKGVRQEISIRQIALSLGFKGRSVVRASLDRMAKAGLVHLSIGRVEGHQVTYLDLAYLRSEAQKLATNRKAVDGIARRPRNGRKLPNARRGGYVRISDHPMYGNRTTPCTDFGPPPVRISDHYQSIQSIQSEPDAPREAFSSTESAGGAPTQPPVTPPRETEEEVRARGLRYLAGVERQEEEARKRSAHLPDPAKNGNGG